MRTGVVLVLRRRFGSSFGALGGGYFVAAAAFFPPYGTTAVSIESITGAVLVCDRYRTGGRLVNWWTSVCTGENGAPSEVDQELAELQMLRLLGAWVTIGIVGEDRWKFRGWSQPHKCCSPWCRCWDWWWLCIENAMKIPASC
jgi:hypothetical protein